MVLQDTWLFEGTIRDNLIYNQTGISDERVIEAAKAVGKDVAEKCKKLKIKKVVFDRGGYQYHGRVEALADAAREAGLEF